MSYFRIDLFMLIVALIYLTAQAKAEEQNQDECGGQIIRAALQSLDPADLGWREHESLRQSFGRSGTDECGRSETGERLHSLVCVHRAAGFVWAPGHLR